MRLRKEQREEAILKLQKLADRGMTVKQVMSILGVKRHMVDRYAKKLNITFKKYNPWDDFA